VIRLERELDQVHGERDRARTTAVRLEQENHKLLLDAKEIDTRRRSIEAYIESVETPGDWPSYDDDIVTNILDDIVKLLDGKIL
jgi:hypothetical protein